MADFFGLNPLQVGAAGIGGAAGIASLFQNQPDFNNPANAARPYFERVPETLKPYYQPYIDRGTRAGSNLDTQFDQMTSNPSQLLKNLSQGYQQSPGYQFKLNQALQAAGNAAAAGGKLGTPEHQQQNEEVAEGIANQDYGDWLRNVLQLYNQGITGEQHAFDTGYGASTDYGTSLANALMNQGLLEERGSEAENLYEQNQANAASSGLGNIMGFAAKVGSWL